MKVVDGKVVAETPEEEAALKGLVETEVSGLKAKRDELLGKLKALDAHKDVDPDEYKVLKAQAAQIEADKLKAAGNWDAREKALLEAHAKEKEQFALRSKADRAELEKFLVDTTALASINDHDAYQKPMLTQIKNMTRVEDVNGRLVATVLDDSGNPRVKADGSYFSIPELVAELKTIPDYMGLFKPSGQSGTGSQQSNGPGVTGAKFADIKSPADRITAARAAGITT